MPLEVTAQPAPDHAPHPDSLKRHAGLEGGFGPIAPFDAAFAHGIYKQKYAHPGEEWADTAARVAHHVLEALPSSRDPRVDTTIDGLAAHKARIGERILRREFIPGGRYLYASGRDLHQTQNCLLMRAEDTREGWSELLQKSAMALMTGAGIGIEYSDVRPSGTLISRTGGVASGPVSLMKIVNETGRNVMQGGLRRSAIWAGLAWWHADIFDFIRVKDWSPEVRALKDKDFTFPADLDMTNISVVLDREFFDAYGSIAGGEAYPENMVIQGASSAPDGRSWPQWASAVYWTVVDKMLTTAEPGFSVNYENARESLRNACTEVTSEDDSDVCNLGSLNLARFKTKEDFGAAVKDATLFLLAGTCYSHLPYDQVAVIREKNRRLGLGIMGVHEWLLVRGKRYGPDAELGEWLEEYARSTEYAHEFADALGISRPIKTRAIAPNGTIGILAETTTSAEPIFAAAYKRRVRNAQVGGDIIQYEYVVDPTAARLIEQGVDSSLIEDAYSLAYDVERRVEMQAWLQQYVDHGISSTVNLPKVIDDPQDQREFGDMLIEYLPRLRGITCYPDGARGGQPLTAVPIEYAMTRTGVRFEEDESRCVGGLCGT